MLFFCAIFGTKKHNILQLCDQIKKSLFVNRKTNKSKMQNQRRCIG